MTILLTGGTGKTSLHLTTHLTRTSTPFILASRSAGNPSTTPSPAAGMPAAHFDWLDPSTHDNPFHYQEKHMPGEEGKISAVYLIAPGVREPAPLVNAFIDLAVQKYGVKRFVFMTGSTAEKGDGSVGEVWKHLVELGVEWCVLRATWFMENFAERVHPVTIRNEGKFFTACGDGKIPFISAADIAAVAFRALTDAKPHNTDYRTLGPELLTHDEIASKLSKNLGREIVHVKISETERVQQYLDKGLPEFYAKFLTSLEVGSAGGMEERMNDDVERVTGRPPQKFDDWVQENKAVWE